MRTSRGKHRQATGEETPSSSTVLTGENQGKMNLHSNTPPTLARREGHVKKVFSKKRFHFSRLIERSHLGSTGRSGIWESHSPGCAPKGIFRDGIIRPLEDERSWGGGTDAESRWAPTECPAALQRTVCRGSRRPRRGGLHGRGVPAWGGGPGDAAPKRPSCRRAVPPAPAGRPRRGDAPRWGAEGRRRPAPGAPADRPPARSVDGRSGRSSRGPGRSAPGPGPRT